MDMHEAVANVLNDVEAEAQAIPQVRDWVEQMLKEFDQASDARKHALYEHALYAEIGALLRAAVNDPSVLQAFKLQQ